MVRFLHTRIRVGDLERSVEFYCKNCGFRVYSRNDKSPAGNKIVNLELPGSEHKLELTYSPDYKLSVPEDLMHTCIGVDDIVQHCQMVEDNGVEIWPSGWKEQFTSGGRKMAFITDPDGYEVEILENK